MKYRHFYLLILSAVLSVATFAKSNAGDAIQLQATVQTKPAQITLSWDALSSPSGSYNVYRKAKGAANWSLLKDNIITTTYTDSSVAAGSAYEYRVQQQGGGNASGYIYAGIRVPPIHSRGALLLLVDTAFTNTCATQIERLMKDISGDGWQVIRKDFASTVDNVTVHNFINAIQYACSKLNAAYIVGHIAVPYSGEINLGDAYYSYMSDMWVDEIAIYTSTAVRSEYKKITSDSDWDEQLQVGRVDLFDMPVFAKTEAAMMQTYLDKAHTYKMDSMAIMKSVLADNNFSVNSYSAAFAANAYCNFPSLAAKDSMKALDFVRTLNNTSYQWAYGYFGNWVSKNNFLSTPLRYDVPALTSGWAGRPRWYFHHMALGENIGYSTLISQNNPTLHAPTAKGYSAPFVHIALMGDPTLRTDYINPPRNVVLTSAPDTGANLSWTASADVDVIGYYVYRSDDRYGAYSKRSDLITGTSYIDSSGTNGLKYYMVRAVKLETTLSGTYYNLSIGEVDSEYILPGVGKRSSRLCERIPHLYQPCK